METNVPARDPDKNPRTAHAPAAAPPSDPLASDPEIPDDSAITPMLVPWYTKPRPQLVLLILFRLTRAIAAGLIAVSFPFLVLKTLHLGSLVLSWLYTSAVIATALLGLAVGQMADRWSRKGTLLVTGIVLPISAVLVFISPTLPMLFVAAILGGYMATGSLIGGGVGGAAQPVQSAIVAELAPPEQRTLYFSWLTFLAGVFGAVGAWLARYFDTRDAFLAAAIISVAGLFFVLPLRVPHRRGAGKQKAASRKASAKFSVTGALNGLSQGLLVPFLIPFFVLVYHLSKAQMATYSGIASILGALSLLAAPTLERRLGFVRAIALTRAVGTVLLVFMAIWHNLDFALAVYVVSPALRIAALPAQQTALTGRVHAEDMGRALAANQVARLGASSAGIVCTGFLFDLEMIELPFFIYAGIMAANIYLYFRFFGEEPAGEAAAAAGKESGR